MRRPPLILRPSRPARMVRVLRPALIPSPICAMSFIPATGGHRIHWVPSTLPPEMARKAREEHADHLRARIVLMLSLACTLLAIYDLSLFATGG